MGSDEKRALSEVREVRIKYWKELTSEERIERMRSRVKELEEDRSGFRAAVIALSQHQHGPAGEVLVSADIRRFLDQSERRWQKDPDNCVW